MENGKNKTLRQLLEEIGDYLYDNGDYNVIKNTDKKAEVKKFVDAYLSGAKILKDGLEGKPLIIKGKAGENSGVTGEEPVCCHDYQIYDMTGSTGEWVIATFADKEAVEKHILSPGGYLNIYCSDMLAIKDGVIQPFEILFAGDDEKTIVLDKDILDEDYDIEGLLARVSINWK